LYLFFLLAFIYLASALPVANPGPVIEPNTVYVRQDANLLAMRDLSDGVDLAKRSPILSWTWFNGGKKVKRDPVLSWTWFNGGKYVKRDPVLSWTWFNGGRKDKRSPVLSWTWFNGGRKE
jgi:hypothetical protein